MQTESELKEDFILAVEARSHLVQATQALLTGADQERLRHEEIARNLAVKLAERSPRLPLMFESSTFLRDAWGAARRAISMRSAATI